VESSGVSGDTTAADASRSPGVGLDSTQRGENFYSRISDEGEEIILLNKLSNKWPNSPTRNYKLLEFLAWLFV